MAILPIITYNDPVLRKKADPIAENSDELQKLIDDMYQTMYNSEGVGLAATQIGKLIRLFIIDCDSMTEETDDPDLGPVAFINPEIVEKSTETVRLEEGCLSIPAVRDDVSRPDSITVEFLNREFEMQRIEVSGWLARVIQHENDHLDGILFIDHLSAFRRRLHKSDLDKIDKGITEAEYPLAPKATGS